VDFKEPLRGIKVARCIISKDSKGRTLFPFQLYSDAQVVVRASFGNFKKVHVALVNVPRRVDDAEVEAVATDLAPWEKDRCALSGPW
jgi:hypothetical protein